MNNNILKDIVSTLEKIIGKDFLYILPFYLATSFVSLFIGYKFGYIDGRFDFLHSVTPESIFTLKNKKYKLQEYNKWF